MKEQRDSGLDVLMVFLIFTWKCCQSGKYHLHISQLHRRDASICPDNNVIKGGVFINVPFILYAPLCVSSAPLSDLHSVSTVTMSS